MESAESSFFSHSPSLICSSSSPLHVDLATQTSRETKEPDAKQISKIFSLPIELLTEIFLLLPPETLYNLTLVCRGLRAVLWPKTLTSTQYIWRTSRIINHPEILKIPKNMSEQQYIWLKIIAKKCQYCNYYERNELMSGIGIYWEFRLFSCDNCIKLNTISYEELINEWKMPQKLLYCLPSINSLTYKDYLLNVYCKNRYYNSRDQYIYSDIFHDYYCFIHGEEEDNCHDNCNFSDDENSKEGDDKKKKKITNKYYLISNVINIRREYDKIKSDYDRDEWIRRKNKEVKEYLEDAGKLIMEDYNNFCNFYEL